MSISKEQKKAEAVSRMKSLGIFPHTIRQLDRKSTRLNSSHS